MGRILSWIGREESAEVKFSEDFHPQRMEELIYVETNKGDRQIAFFKIESATFAISLGELLDAMKKTAIDFVTGLNGRPYTTGEPCMVNPTISIGRKNRLVYAENTKKRA